MISDHTRKVMTSVMNDFEQIMTEHGTAGHEATEALVRQFGIELDELSYICATMGQFFLMEEISMIEGLQLSILVGLMMGRAFDASLRDELNSELHKLSGGEDN